MLRPIHRKLDRLRARLESKEELRLLAYDEYLARGTPLGSLE